MGKIRNFKRYAFMYEMKNKILLIYMLVCTLPYWGKCQFSFSNDFQFEIASGLNFSSSSFGQNNNTFYPGDQNVQPAFGGLFRLGVTYPLSRSHGFHTGLRYHSFNYEHNLDGWVQPPDTINTSYSTEAVLMRKLSGHGIGVDIGWNFTSKNYSWQLSPRIAYNSIVTQPSSLKIVKAEDGTIVSNGTKKKPNLKSRNLVIEILVMYRLIQFKESNLRLGLSAEYNFLKDDLTLTQTTGNRYTFNFLISYLIL